MRKTEQSTAGAIPRRNRYELLVPAEKLIRQALVALEDLGASPALTDAVVHLTEASQCVADHVDAKLETLLPDQAIQRSMEEG